MADQNLDIVIKVRGGEVASSEIKGVSGSIDQVGKSSESTSKKTSSLRSSLGTLATGFAVYKGYQFIKSAVNETTSLAKATSSLSRISGMDSQTSSAWVQIAKERGVQSKQLNQGFVTLSKNIVGVGQNSKPAIAAFQQLGIGTAGLAQMKPEEVLNSVADAFQKMPNGADKATLAQKLFGRQSQALLPLLNGGSKALNDQVAAMSKHLGMSQKTEAQSLALAKQQRELSATMVGVKVAIATALLPILTTLAQIIGPIAEKFAQLMTSSSGFRIAVIVLTAALVTFIVALKTIELLSIDIEATWLLIPAALVAVGVGLYLLYTKCAWFRNAVQAVMHAIVDAFNWIKTAAGAVVSWISGHWQLLAGLLFGPIGIAVAEIISHFKQITSAASSAFGAVTSAVKAVAGVITSILGGAFSAVKSVIDSIGSAIGGIVSAANKITSLPGKIANKLSFGLIGGATGGTITHSGAILVGEAGPEIVHLPSGAQITPNHEIGSGGGVHHVTIPVHLDGYQVGKAFGSYVAGQQARR